MATFNLIMKKNINKNQPNKNEIMASQTKEEIIQQIRTNFALLGEYTPSTTMITEKMDQHLLSCNAVNHVFFEVDPICSSLGLLNNGSSLQHHLLNSFHFMKHLSTYGKKVFLDKHLFDLINLDHDSFRFWLDPPYFESNLDKLFSNIKGTSFARDIILKKYKQHLEQHLSVCKGPCKLNMLGVPICRKKKCEVESLDKMFCALYIFLKSESTIQLKQTLFDMCYDAKHYNDVIEFIAINVARNTHLQKIIYG